MIRLFASVLAPVLLALPAMGAGVPPDRPAPDLSLERIDGGQLKLSDYRGKLVLVNFWATWCPPCRKEMPDLQDFHRSHEDTVVIGLTLDYSSRKKVAQALEEMGIHYPVVLADNEIAARFGSFRGLPTTFFVSPEGRIVDRHMGLMSREQMEAHRERILGR